MKKMGVFAVVLAMVCLFAGVASAEKPVEGYLGGAFANNPGQATTIKELPATGENNVTQLRHLQTVPSVSPPSKPPADTGFKPLKQQEEPLREPEFM